MEPVLSMQTAAVLLGLAAVGGLAMAAIRWSGKPHPPTALAMAHGFLAAAAVTLLLYAACTVGLPPLAQGALALFIVAAIGGTVLNLRYHWQRLPLPLWLVGVHAVVAVLGYALLLAALYTRTPGTV